jgi:hypothetical protein
MLNVTPSKNLAHEPATATLWVDGSGTIAYLHRISPTEYQLTRLRCGTPLAQGGNKALLVAGFCLFTAAVTLTNSA